MNNKKTFIMNKFLHSLFAVIFVCSVLLLAAWIVPTSCPYSTDTIQVEKRLLQDLSISSDQLEFMKGWFQREPIIIYRVTGTLLVSNRFSRIEFEPTKADYIKRFAELGEKSGENFSLSTDAEFFTYVAGLYSVVYVRSSSSSYLVYFGGQ